MAWLRLDDNAPHHRKVLAAGDVGAWLWICGLAHCQRHATDGRIPREAVPFLGCTGWRAGLPKLVKAGLWRETPDGYDVHDFLEWNDSAADRDTKTDQKTARMKRWRESKRRGGSRDVDASTAVPPETPGDAAPTPTPTPTPDHKTYGAAAPRSRPMVWRQGLAIAHAVMDECPDRNDWTSEFKARCREQGLDYGEVDSAGRPMFARALEAAEAIRGQRARAAS